MPEETFKIDNETAKDIMLNILSAVADYCDANGLRYFLAFGTLLGAIRHKGFIPWDNDIDIWMPRPDYNRFREMTKTNPINENIQCLDYREERTFPFLKVSDKRTRLKEHFLVTENLGLYVDIFPLDGLPEVDSIRNETFAMTERYKLLFALANYRFNTGSNRKVKLLKNIFYPFSRLMNNTKICMKLDALCNEYDFDNSVFVGSVVWGYERKTLRKDWFEVSDGQFEGRNYKIPANYDAILKTYYGDYMTLPPEDNRIVHYYDVSWKEGIDCES